jgi:hypothetical protein
MISNNLIFGNSADSGGGLGCFNNKFTTIRDNRIFQNACEELGGGIYCAHSSQIIISNNEIFGNSSVGVGGGIYCGSFSSSPFHVIHITGNRIYDNTSALDGGGLRIVHDSPVVSNNMIYLNEAGTLGGGISCSGGAPVITNNTLFKNSASLYGGGMVFRSGAVSRVANTILWNNEAPLITGIYIGENPPSLGPQDPSKVFINHCDLEGGLASVQVEPGNTLNWGSGMIDSDPMFVDPAMGDFHLTFLSPCRGSGDNSTVAKLHDFEGDPRVAYGTVDMGADEFYTHFYCTGDFSPSGSIEGKLTGLPGTSPVGLFFGFGVLDPPLQTPWGSFHLQPPVALIPLIPIPANGVLALPATIPLSPAAPYDLPMQALIGLGPDSLSNLFVLEVR